MNSHAAIMQFLSDGRWHKAAEIALNVGIGPRAIRELAEETGDFIGGQEGYKRADLATQEERDHAVASLKSRAGKIQRRARSLERLSEAPADRQLSMF